MPGRTDTLVQTLLAPDVAAWVRSRAALDGLQVSGWIRQLIARERMRLVVEAWWCGPGDAPKRTRSEAPAPFRLERLGCVADGTVEFKLLDPALSAITDAELAATHAAIRSALYEGTFVLRGDTRRWRVLHAAADAEADNAMRLVMRPESRAERKGAR